jgi:hypothetical protein
MILRSREEDRHKREELGMDMNKDERLLKGSRSNFHLGKRGRH